MIPFDEIPQGIQDEINASGRYDFDRYGELDVVNSVSRKLSYQEEAPFKSPKKIVDPNTFEIRDGAEISEKTHRMIRGFMVKMNGNSVRQVVSTGDVLVERILGQVI